MNSGAAEYPAAAIIHRFDCSDEQLAELCAIEHPYGRFRTPKRAMAPAMICIATPTTHPCMMA